MRNSIKSLSSLKNEQFKKLTLEFKEIFDEYDHKAMLIERDIVEEIEIEIESLTPNYLEK